MVWVAIFDEWRGSFGMVHDNFDSSDCPHITGAFRSLEMQSCETGFNFSLLFSDDGCPHVPNWKPLVVRATEKNVANRWAIPRTSAMVLVAASGMRGSA
eukprot:272583-Rhodomonas_salina.1